MAYTDEQLFELRKKLAGRDNLYKTIRTLSLKKKEIEERLKPLEETKNKEHSDVEKLERGGIKSFFYSLIGQRVERLNKEKDEAYEADKRYEAVYKEYSALCDTLDFYLKEINSLNECENMLDSLVKEKKLDMKKAGHPFVQEIEPEEKQLVKLSEQTENTRLCAFAARELKDSMAMLYEIVENLYYSTRDSGREWRTVDFLTGGSVRDGRTVSTMFSEQLKRLEGQVSSLTYSDVTIKAQLKELRVFADRMSLLFSSSSAFAPVENIYEKAKENRERVSSVEFALIELCNEKREECFSLKNKITDMVIDTKLQCE